MRKQKAPNIPVYPLLSKKDLGRRLKQATRSDKSDRSLDVARRLSVLSKTAWGQSYREALDSGSFERILSLGSPVKADYVSSESFAIDYLLSEVLSKIKLPVWKSPSELADIAVGKFIESEDLCRQTNMRLSREFRLTGSTSFDRVLMTAQRKIAACLGEFDWDVVSQQFRHGAHACTRLPRHKGDLYYKFGGLPDSTKECETLSRIAISLIKPWSKAGEQQLFQGEINIVPGNRITTVPKSAKVDRVIAIEPDLNMFIQKGFGNVIRARLKRKGVNLDDQTGNQKLSREAARTGKLATIDLSMASDLISSKVVELLIPPDWYSALDMCRSHYGTWPDGTCKRYQKFSTMGNGFTFELESLIFWGLCSAVIEVESPTDKRLGVYGDDLIVSSDIYESVVYTLMRFGFVTNAKKSYATGPFRESCGKHWFEDREVTPFYVREGTRKLVDKLVIVNNVRRWATRVYSGFLPPDVWACYVDIRDMLLPDWVVANLRIPDGYGDFGVVSSFEEAAPTCIPRVAVCRCNRSACLYHGLEGWVCDSFIAQITRGKKTVYRVSGDSLMLKSLYRLETSGRDPLVRWEPATAGGVHDSDDIQIIKGRESLKPSKLLVTRWEDTGIPLR